MYEKAQRIAALARAPLFARIAGADPNPEAARAGILCKADLVTEMVGEFPDLQGVMGRYYAADSARSSQWARPSRALRAAGPGDHLPDGAGECRRGARRQARHAGRVLRHRRAADWLQGSLCAAPRRPRRDPAHHRESAASAPWRRAEEALPATATCFRQNRGQARRPPPRKRCSAFSPTGSRCICAKGRASRSGQRRLRGGGEDDLVRLLERVDALEELSQDGRRRQSAHRLPPRRQHPPHRGKEGRPAL